MLRAIDFLGKDWLLWLQGRSSFFALSSLLFLASKNCIREWESVVKTCIQDGSLPDSPYFWLSICADITLIVLYGCSSYHRIERLGHPGILALPWASLFVIPYFKWFSVQVPGHYVFPFVAAFFLIGMYLSLAKEKPPTENANEKRSQASPRTARA
jgi:hypothetical protein